MEIIKKVIHYLYVSILTIASLAITLIAIFK